MDVLRFSMGLTHELGQKLDKMNLEIISDDHLVN